MTETIRVQVLSQGEWKTIATNNDPNTELSIDVKRPPMTVGDYRLMKDAAAEDGKGTE